MCPAVPSSPVSFRKVIPLITTVSDVCGMELLANGLRQGFAFSTTVICRYFWLRFVPGTNGKSIRVELSVPPARICPSFGYLNWKRYVEFVKVSQSPGIGGEVGVKVDVGPAGVGEIVGVIGAGDGVNV